MAKKDEKNLNITIKNHYDVLSGDNSDLSSSKELWFNIGQPAASAKFMYERARLHEDVEIRYYPNKELLIKALSDESVEILKQGDTILVKASHGMGFSEVVEFLDK